MNTLKLFKSKNNKKGLMALESLIGIILSVIGLVILIGVIVQTFWSFNPGSLQIAKSNAESMKEFIEFSQNKYEKNSNCYTMLKLFNLENFQYEEKNNYIYILIKDKINIYRLDDFLILMDKIDTNNINNMDEMGNTVYDNSMNFNLEINKLHPIKEYKLNQEYILKLDETQDSSFTLNYYFFSINALSNNLILEKVIDGIILIPNLGDKQNKYKTMIIIDGEVKEIEGYYLALNPKSKEIFLTSSEFSNLLVKTQGCAIKNLYAQNYNIYLSKNPSYADFISEKLTFDGVDTKGNLMNFIFKWSYNKIECPVSEGKECKDYLGESFELLSYDAFLTKIWSVLNTKFPNLKELRLIDRERLILDTNSVKILDEKGLYYDSDKLFLKYDSDIDLRYDAKLSESEAKKLLEKEFGEEIFWDFNKERIDKSSCESVYCDFLGYKNSQIYFYNQDLKSFVSFNTNYLRKSLDGNKYYFRGEELRIKDQTFDDVDWSIFKKNYGLNLIDITISSSEKRTVGLSKIQLNYIKEVDEE